MEAFRGSGRMDLMAGQDLKFFVAAMGQECAKESLTPL
jgi:hypothetical protein